MIWFSNYGNIRYSCCSDFAARTNISRLAKCNVCCLHMNSSSQIINHIGLFNKLFRLEIFFSSTYGFVFIQRKNRLLISQPPKYSRTVLRLTNKVSPVHFLTLNSCVLRFLKFYNEISLFYHTEALKCSQKGFGLSCFSRSRCQSYALRLLYSFTEIQATLKCLISH